MQRKKTVALMIGLLWCNMSFAQQSQLQSGPMVGYSQMREVMLWVQTKSAAKVKIIYTDKIAPALKHSTAEVLTEKSTGFTAHLLADEVEAGKTYTYQVVINGTPFKLPYPTVFQTQPLWQARTDPPAFKLALGSCTYVSEPTTDRPGTPYGGDYGIFTAINNLRPDAMLWLGDNTYFRETDWTSRTGMLRRYTHTRALPELQPLLAATHHYAIWDDHDFGPNDSDRSFWNKAASLDIFKSFWANPAYGFPTDNGESLPAAVCQFQWADIDFFCLDDRTFRSPNNRSQGERTILGEDQFKWLIDALAFSKATFKVIAMGGQVLNSAATLETYATFPQERQRLIDAITKEKISGVLFLTGDRHHTELSILPRGDSTYALHDFTISPLTSGLSTVQNEPNTLRAEGTLTREKNFAMMEVGGTLANRAMTITIYSNRGKPLWSRTLNAKELR